MGGIIILGVSGILSRSSIERLSQVGHALLDRRDAEAQHSWTISLD
jgi:hypothetical protein